MRKNVLVTGADHGLGHSLVKTFLEHGYTVFAGVFKHGSERRISELDGHEGLHLVELDVSDRSSVKAALLFVEGLAPSLDVLVNNAGMMPRDEITGEKKTIYDELDFEAIGEVININAVGALRVANAFAGLLMRGTDKLLINISSEAGSIADCYRDEWFGYCMSKAALNMAGAIIQNELRKAGGQVWQIHPGWLQTYMSGTKNEEATLTPDFSAERIFELIRDADRYRSDQAVFMDLFGAPMRW